MAAAAGRAAARAAVGGGATGAASLLGFVAVVGDQQRRGQQGPARCDDGSRTAAAQHERACSLILNHLLGGNSRRGRGAPLSREQGRAHQQPPTNPASGERMKRWLRRTVAGVECRDGLGRSALALAAMQGDAPAAEALLEWGYDPNCPDGNHLSPLSYAAWKGHPDVVRLLLQEGADPQHMDDFGVTPMHKAAAFGHALILTQLLRASPNPTEAANLRTGAVNAPPSYEAISQHQAPLHLSLRQSAANITPETRRELTALLLGFGADPNVRDVKGDSALHYACRLGDPLVVWSLLVEGRADPDARNREGATPVSVLPWYALYLAPLLLVPASVWGGGGRPRRPVVRGD